MRFSQRIGARPPFTGGLQSAPAELRVVLWNDLHEELLPKGNDRYRQYQASAAALWNFLHRRIDEVPAYVEHGRDQLSAVWFQCEWPEFFDLLEFAVHVLVRRNRATAHQLFPAMNGILATYGSGYRFVAQTLCALSNPQEVAVVEGAAESSIPAVAEHIRAALALMPPNRDASPRNAVKESISAVEAALKHLTEDKSGTLASALPSFEKRYGPFHPAFRQALEKLYAYAGDERGIRHALTDEDANVTLDDARFMLVVCSAFANYLLARAGAKP